MKTEMKLYKIQCTFSYLGKKKDVENWLQKENVVIEESEFVGEEYEHHSGFFTEYFGVYQDESFKDVLNNYFYHNKDIVYQECFSVYDDDNKLILTD